MIRIIKLYFKTLSMITPTLAGKHAFLLFQKTRKKIVRKNERQFYNLSRHFRISHHLEDIDCYELGDPKNPLVLLVHGWDSNAGSMAAIAFQLVEQGYYVVAFNLPAHGFSKLKRANLKICREYFLAVVEKMYPDKPFSVIAHSFGSAVSTFSLADSRFDIDKLVLLTNPNKFGEVLQGYQSFVKLSDKAFEKTLEMAQKLIGKPVAEMNIEDMHKSFNYNKLLLIHDRQDKVLPYQNSIAVHKKWNNSELVTLESIGHYKMLWNEHVINSIMRFIASPEGIELKESKSKIAS
ncbi:alpha/beta hydrolase [Reichenbachiella sp. MALMAid0571]|uniref:alpha/beta hydrolase n=1 Tax=Reichenbachiella sp. MALMAid0571 TaxID=3143939 RepID=UPI0032DFE0A8